MQCTWRRHVQTDGAPACGFLPASDRTLLVSNSEALPSPGKGPVRGERAQGASSAPLPPLAVLGVISNLSPEWGRHQAEGTAPCTDAEPGRRACKQVWLSDHSKQQLGHQGRAGASGAGASEPGCARMPAGECSPRKRCALIPRLTPRPSPHACSGSFLTAGFFFINSKGRKPRLCGTSSSSPPPIVY